MRGTIFLNHFEAISLPSCKVQGLGLERVYRLRGIDPQIAAPTSAVSPEVWGWGFQLKSLVHEIHSLGNACGRLDGF